MLELDDPQLNAWCCKAKTAQTCISRKLSGSILESPHECKSANKIWKTLWNVLERYAFLNNRLIKGRFFIYLKYKILMVCWHLRIEIVNSLRFSTNERCNWRRINGYGKAKLCFRTGRSKYECAWCAWRWKEIPVRICEDSPISGKAKITAYWKLYP